MKQTPRILAALALSLLLPWGLPGCDSGSEADRSVAASPFNEVDGMLNDYEKAAHAFIKTAKKMKGGDVSLTVRYLNQKNEVQKWPAQHQALWTRMNPAQQQRAAAILATAAPYFPTS